MKNTLEHAINYLSQGFNVIPLQPRGKKPAIPSWKKYQSERVSEDELVRWFGNGSKNNIGIVTGGISGITVIDLDSPEAIKFAKEKLPAAPTVTTARGKHLYFKHMGGLQNAVKVNNLDIDLRNDGGYMVAPPSFHESGIEYSWDAEFNLDTIPLTDVPNFILSHIQQQKKPLNNLIKNVPEGQRNDALIRLIGLWASLDWSYDDVLQTALACNSSYKPPMPDEEIETKVRAIYEKHIGKGDI